MNSVILIGRLTADPQTHAGEKHESATFRLAVPRTVGDGADFVDIVCFDKLAATCAEWLTKGREVAVVGMLRLNEWTSREGERRSRLQVVADAVQFLGAPKTTKPAADGDDPPAHRPALGAYRRKTGWPPLRAAGTPGRPAVGAACSASGGPPRTLEASVAALEKALARVDAPVRTRPCPATGPLPPPWASACRRRGRSRTLGPANFCWTGPPRGTTPPA